MKPNQRRDPSGRRALAIILALTIVLIIAVGVYALYTKLHALWIEQCVVRDLAAQVTITSGKMVTEATIRDAFDLKNGANLALIDFAEKRQETLRRYPTIRSLTVTRRLPDGVTIAVIEREPTVRLKAIGAKTDSGLVADTEGVAFPCRRGTSILPVILMPKLPAAGERIQRRAMAALRLLETARDPDLSELGILEVSLASPDYLTATLGNYSTAKIAWEGMNDDDLGPAALHRQLSLLAASIRANVRPHTTIWNATLPDTVFDSNRGSRQ